MISFSLLTISLRGYQRSIAYCLFSLKLLCQHINFTLLLLCYSLQLGDQLLYSTSIFSILRTSVSSLGGRTYIDFLVILLLSNQIV